MAVIEEKGLVQISNTAELEGVVDAVVSRHADAVAQYRSGKQGSLSFLVGPAEGAFKRCLEEERDFTSFGNIRLRSNTLLLN